MKFRSCFNSPNSKREFYSLCLVSEKCTRGLSKQENHTLFMRTLGTAINNSVYTALCKQKAGAACLCSSAVADTPAGEYGMHQNVMTTCTACCHQMP